MAAGLWPAVIAALVLALALALAGVREESGAALSTDEASLLQVATLIDRGTAREPRDTSQIQPALVHRADGNQKERIASGLASGQQAPAAALVAAFPRASSLVSAWQTRRAQTNFGHVLAIFMIILVAGGGLILTFIRYRDWASQQQTRASRGLSGVTGTGLGTSPQLRMQQPEVRSSLSAPSRSPVMTSGARTPAASFGSNPFAVEPKGLPTLEDDDSIIRGTATATPVQSLPQPSGKPPLGANMLAMPALIFPPVEPQSSVNYQVNGPAGQKLFHVNLMRPHRDFQGSKPGAAQEYVALLSADQLEEHSVLTVNTPSAGTDGRSWRCCVFGRQIELSESTSASTHADEGRCFILKQVRGSVPILTIRGDPRRHRLVVLGPGGDDVVVAHAEPEAGSEDVYHLTVRAPEMEIPLLVMALLGVDRLTSYMEAAALAARELTGEAAG